MGSANRYGPSASRDITMVPALETMVAPSRRDLSQAQSELIEATRTRFHYMKAAREYGMTHAEIGDALGVSEAAVRSMLKRHSGDA